MAGFLYLAFIVIFACSSFIRSGFTVSGNIAATTHTIVASAQLFRIGLISELVSAALFFLAAWALYVLLEPVDQRLALLFLLLNLGGVAIECLNTLNLFGVLLLLGGADYLKAFQAEQVQAAAMFLLDVYRNGFIIAQLFFGTWLLPLGYLVFKSGFLPRILGILLIADFFGVLIWFLQFFLLPGYAVITYPGLAISFIAEVSLSLWLLIKGVNVERLKERVPASA